ncbi:hypothetical protein C900_02967 [Fulvivirga imtechensis AK7]|uniref:Integral membrane protein n=2 Tax=Fulvivirga TaxID=396811 RepID=L8JSI2_9BACT|nr:hypothetical protein C900_02967 [Fulvivirga imtechensis AK7]
MSSGATGLLMVFFSTQLAEWFGVSESSGFAGVGIFLVAFAILVFAEARSHPHRKGRLRLIIVMDIMWVIGSIIILLFQPFSFTSIGNVLTAGVALWVAGMAYFQFAGLKQLQKEAGV